VDPWTHGFAGLSAAFGGRERIVDQQLFEYIQEVQRKSLFRADKGSGSARVVDSPFLGGSIASAFERVVRFDEPAIEIARLGLHEVHLVGCAFDAVKDGLGKLGELAKWNIDGSINVRYMAGGRC